MKFYYVYILKCSDDSYYTGVTNNLEKRFKEHNSGEVKTSYTHNRRPIIIVFSQQFNDINQAIALEKQIKGWSRRKKEALINSDWNNLKLFSKNNSEFGNKIKNPE